MAAGQMTGETVKSSVSLAIKEFFKVVNGDVTTYPIIYKEQQVQDYEKPSFFIWTNDVGQRKVRGNIYDRDYQMNVRYHPNDDDVDKYQTLCQVGEDLLDCLSAVNMPISIDGITEIKLPVKGDQMEYKITDNVLQFFVTYTVRVKKFETADPYMETIAINQV